MGTLVGETDGPLIGSVEGLPLNATVTGVALESPGQMLGAAEASGSSGTFEEDGEIERLWFG